MAMADYYICDCCKAAKTFYDARLDYREDGDPQQNWNPETYHHKN